ncbi:PAS domain S-box protein [Siccirubricoccus sp. KC 17139]|uniref:histidine kinase n=1 Tax=Siccirubricoccus soli TaxID=2899147 RepID=A0ABT1D1U4_9PROT|nr:HWE histidine kinase domain-containing protein [Siccirubricoccus soli]MCO6415864.1 PAS domain S-box protein [Siccirubricoccus soli]MCP2681996.1 PAS domain S-box protein [Siccirubricoccus soli]
MRRALAQAGVSAAEVAGLDADELARERADRAADRGVAQSAAVEAEARHGREMAAGRADLAASQAANKALRRANAALAESRAALRAHEERLHLILDSTADYAIFTTDLDRRITSWNAGAERVLGWTEKEILGRPADIIFTPEDRAAGVPQREAATALAEGRAENERWHLRQDGTRFWASGQSMPLRDPAAGSEAPPLGLLAIMRDQTDRKRAEERRAVLTNELNHRVKNTLAVVQSLTRLGTRGASPDLSSFAAAFQRRIFALARAHDLLTHEDWTGAPLDGVVRAGLTPLVVDGGRVDLSGCDAEEVFLPAGAALTLAMAVHELATNALRHGALSVPSGHVRVACRAANAENGGTARDTVEWVERGGPPIVGPPARRGFGLRLLERGLAMQSGMGADLRFEPEGLRCTLYLPSSRLARPGRRADGA